MAKQTKAPRKKDERIQVFIKSYLLHGNATQAAIDAGYSKKTAYSQANRLLSYVEVQQALAAHREQISNELEQEWNITKDMIKQRLAGFAMTDVADVMTWETTESGYTDVRLKNSSEIQKKHHAGIAHIRFKRRRLDLPMSADKDGVLSAVIDEEFDVKMRDGVRASEVLAKTMGMFDNRESNDQSDEAKAALDARLLELLDQHKKTKS